MSISDIDARIRGQLPTVVLSPETFGDDPALTPILRQYFSDTGGRITVAGVEASAYHFDPEAGIITFSGAGHGGPFDGMTIDKVVVKTVGGAPQVFVAATAPDGWVLYRGFPDLNSPVLQQLPFRNPQLFWASYDSDADQTIKSFYFLANLDMDAPPLDLLSVLFPGMKAPPIWGQIDMAGSSDGAVTQYVPDMMLTIDASQNTASLGPLTLYGPQLKIFSNPFFNTFDRNWQTNNFVKVTSALKFKSSWVLFEADIKDVRSDILFEASLDAPLGAALAELIDFVGGAALGVPGFDIRFPDGLLLKNVTVGFNPAAAQKVKFVALHVGTAPEEKWRLWSDEVFLEDINLVFRVLPGAGATQVEGEIYGVVSGWLNLRASFASGGSYSFYGGLAKPLPLKDAYAFFAGHTLADLPDVELETLYFRLSLPPAAGRAGFAYEGEMTLKGDWQLVSHPTPVSLRGLLFKLAHDPQAAATTFEAGGLIDVSDYAVSVDALYVTNQGWTFKGDLALIGENESLASIGSKIDGSFPVSGGGGPSIPAFLASWYVLSLSTEFNTQSRNFDFVVDVKNSALPALGLGFGVHLLHGPDSFSKEFDGTAVYADGKMSVEFDLAVKEVTTNAPASKTVTVTGTYKAAKPPRLSDLLRAVSRDAGVDANLPAELNLDAEADGLVVVVEQKDADEPVVEVAGAFTLQIEGSTLHLYLAYTNRTAFDQEWQQPALVNGKRAYVLGVALGGVIDLSRLPVVGSIPGIDRLRLDKLGFYYTNAQFAQAGRQLYFQAPEVAGAGQLAPNPTTSAVNKSGFSLTATIGTHAGAGAAPLLPFGQTPLPVGTGAHPPAQPPAFAAGQAQPTTPVNWLDVNQTFGPVALKQVGLNYAAGEATVGFSAGLTFGGFTLDLQGLTVTFPMPLPGHKAGGQLAFDLQGLAFDIKRGGLEIGGFFLKVLEQGHASFYGGVLVQAANFGFKAVGGFSPSAHPPSFFIYANLDVPLGGPPYLFVTGLAGGFGINRRLKLPTIDTLPGYRLLPSNAPQQAGSAADTVTKILPELEIIFGDAPGEYWVAAGIQFTSFEMINAFALLTVAFGVDLQVALLGTCAMTLPTGDPYPVAYVEVDILASFTPATGLLAVEGRLSPASFVYGGFVHLAGGFAFYIWFAGEHKGDFVVSLGGYHPAFVKPAHYPVVPRLGLSFGLGPFQVIGQAYFALTPAMMMAGLALRATWSSGPVRAWLDAGLDFLIAWAPFHYEADAYINIGVSVDLGLFNINIHVGADLHIWGPPFGGKAHIDLDVVAFTINFGAEPAAPPPVGWATFKANFLPQDTRPPAPHAPAPRAPLAATAAVGDARPRTNIIKAGASAGLLQQDVGGYDWVLDPDDFAVLTNSTLPANNAVWNPAAADKTEIHNRVSDFGRAAASGLYLRAPAETFSDAEVWNPTLHIGPMKQDDVQSFHNVTLLKRAEGDPAGTFSDPVASVSVEPVLLAANAALWSKHNPNPSPNDAPFVPRSLTGFLISPTPQVPDRLDEVPLGDLLFAKGYETGFAYQSQQVDPHYTVGAAADAEGRLTIKVSGAHAETLVNQNYILSALEDAWVAERRAAVLADLAANDFHTHTPAEIDLSALATRQALTDWPAVELLGADPADTAGPGRARKRR